MNSDSRKSGVGRSARDSARGARSDRAGRAAGTIPARQARSRKTVERLLAAAEEVFGREGVSGATVAEICRVAGVGVGTFYGRFRDKDAFLAAFFTDHYRVARERLDDTFRLEHWEGRPAAEITAAWVARRVERFRNGRALTRAILTYTRAHPNQAFRTAVASFSALVVDRFDELLRNAADPIRHPAPRRAAVIAVSAVEALLKEIALYGGVRSTALAIADEELTPELTRMVDGYLGLRPGPDAP